MFDKDAKINVDIDDVQKANLQIDDLKSMESDEADMDKQVDKKYDFKFEKKIDF